MKNKLLILLQFISLSIFCQFQPLETLNEVMIGPENVNMHFEEQVEFYVEKYNRMLVYMEELKTEHEVELERLEGSKKKRLWRKNQIKKEEDAINLLTEDMIVVEDYISAWSEVQIENTIRFNEEYDSNSCYEISSKRKIYFPNEYSIKPEERDSIFWEEFIPKDMVQKIEHTRISQSVGHKWVRLRNNKNCLSNDPKDCMVWCLVEVPRKYQVFNYSDEVPKPFKLSEEEEGFIKKQSLERTNDNQYRLFDIRENKEIALVNFKVVNCN